MLVGALGRPRRPPRGHARMRDVLEVDRHVGVPPQGCGAPLPPAAGVWDGRSSAIQGGHLSLSRSSRPVRNRRPRSIGRPRPTRSRPSMLAEATTRPAPRPSRVQSLAGAARGRASAADWSPAQKGGRRVEQIMGTAIWVEPSGQPRALECCAIAIT